jgi:hypothetical protein
MPPGLLNSIGPIPIRLTESLGIEPWGWERRGGSRRGTTRPRYTPHPFTIALPHGELSYVSSN